MAKLLDEHFLDFPIGEFPYDRDHSATGEYHYVREEGFAGVWVDQVCNYTYNGTGPTWIITEQDGRHFMEQMRIEKGRPHRMFPTLQTGSPHWRDYLLRATLRRISQKGMAGIAFCMQNSLDTLVFSVEYGRAVLTHRHKEELCELASAPYETNCDDFFTLEARCSGEKVVCLINGQRVLEASTPLAARGGKVGMTADCPTQFTDVVCEADDAALAAIARSEAEALRREAAAQAALPAMKLWKKIDLHNFGTSRQIRFGHLTGTDEWHIVLAQAQKRVARDSYAHINCLTAIDLDGNILWQRGEPSAKSRALGKISADMPFQVYDIDGDGRDEVICGINFEILVLDGATGEVKKRAKTPIAGYDDPSLPGADNSMYAFDRLNPDGIRICNFSGKAHPSDILIKDRYTRVYALNSDLELMWQYKCPKNTGHYPMAVDINGDGYDEVLVGYCMLDRSGHELWTYPIEKDHTDEIVAGKFMDGDEHGYFACVSGTQGFFIGDMHGNIVARDMIGHAQRVSVGNFIPERKGFEIAASNFWGHQGIIYLYDGKGQPVLEYENELNGNILAPVNWKGDGADLILTNPDPKRGGLIDGHGVRALAFPDDGHPVMCCEAIDLTGDARDELVVWDYNSLWIYTQSDGPFAGAYAPVKYPHRNASNYRGEYSFPDESYITFNEKQEKSQ